MPRRVLIVSSATALASEIERELGPGYEVHAAPTDDAANTLLNVNRYGCVVLDVRTSSTAGRATAQAVPPDIPTILFASRRDEEHDESIADVAESIRRAINR